MWEERPPISASPCCPKEKRWDHGNRGGYPKGYGRGYHQGYPRPVLGAVPHRVPFFFISFFLFIFCFRKEREEFGIDFVVFEPSDLEERSPYLHPAYTRPAE